MLKFTTTILQFEAKGEKTGWTYIEIPQDITEELKPGNKKSFRVKGKLDDFAIEGMALIPMGGGRFIMALNTEIRKGIKKRKGAMLSVALQADYKPLKVSPQLMECLTDEPEALAFFKSLAPSHQVYFGNWIDSAKTEITKAKRIAQTVNAMSRKWDYGTMIRFYRDNKAE